MLMSDPDSHAADPGSELPARPTPHDADAGADASAYALRVRQRIAQRARHLSAALIRRHFLPPGVLESALVGEAQMHGLLRHARAQLLLRLIRPITLDLGDTQRRVVFCDAITYVFDSQACDVWVEAQRGLGNWVRIVGCFDIFRPLSSQDWIDEFVGSWWAQQAPALDRDADSALRAWIVDGLRRELNRLDLTSLLRAEIRRHFTPLPEVVQLAVHSLPARRALGLSSFEYARAWRVSADTWTFAGSAANLRVMFLIALRAGWVRDGDGINVLRQAMVDKGVKPLGWRLACRHGRAAFAPVLRAANSPDLADAVAQHLGLLGALNREQLPPLQLTRALYLQWVHGSRAIARLPPAFVRRAWDQLDQHAAAGTGDWFIREEFLVLLEWVRAHPPTLDRNQLRAPWTRWMAAYGDWIAWRSVGASSFAGLVDEFDDGPFLVRPLRSAADLIEEGAAMHHCAEHYVERCVGGNYLMFSVRNRRDHRRAATVGLRREGSVWVLDKMSAHANRVASATLRRVAARLVERCCARQQIVAATSAARETAAEVDCRQDRERLRAELAPDVCARFDSLREQFPDLIVDQLEQQAASLAVLMRRVSELEKAQASSGRATGGALQLDGEQHLPAYGWVPPDFTDRADASAATGAGIT